MTEILTRANLLNVDAQVPYDNLRTILQERDNVSNDFANDLSNVVQQAGPDRLIIDLQKFWS